MSDDTPKTKKNNNKLVIILLFVVFAGPMLFAWVLVKKSEQREFRTTNHGEIVSPQQNLSKLKLYSVTENKEIKWSDLGNKWWLIYLGPNTCNEDCHEILYNMRQIRTALHKNSTRLERMFLTLPECDTSSCDNYLIEHYPDMHRMRIEKEDFERIFGSISDPLMRKTVGEIYIVDPKNTLVLQYSGETESRGILSDLKRLLRLSKIG
jgi:cytochrome oxidase Cu insertion factor (SCO1/SenC/PrrC family)